ncbi:MAG: LytTR family DNA-binding domain-containing protein [Bacteroidota bacterium]
MQITHPLQLDQPVGFLHSARDKWLFIIFINVFTPAFLIAFQPFGVNNYDPTQSLDTVFVLAMISFGIINGCVMTANEFLVYRSIFNSPMTRMQLLAWLLWNLVLVSGSSYLWYNILGNFHDWSGLGYLKFMRDIGMMGILPMAGLILYFQNQSAKAEIKSLVKFKPIRSAGSRMVFLSSENGKDKIGIALNQLLYLEAQDNYVAVFHLEGDVIRKNLFRNTLKNMEASFHELPVVRCHRSYLVNLANIQSIARKGRQLKLYLTDLPHPISVSRSYLEDFLKYLG